MGVEVVMPVLLKSTPAPSVRVLGLHLTPQGSLTSWIFLLLLYFSEVRIIYLCGKTVH